MRGSPAAQRALTREETAEERRLWADYYDAVRRQLEIMRREGTAELAASGIFAEHAAASRAIARLKQLYGLP